MEGTKNVLNMPTVNLPCDIDYREIRSWKEYDQNITYRTEKILNDIRDATNRRKPYLISKCELDTVLFCDLQDLVKLYNDSLTTRIKDYVYTGRMIRDGKFWIVNTSEIEIKGIPSISDKVYHGSDINYALQGMASYFNDSYPELTIPVLTGAWNISQASAAAFELNTGRIRKKWSGIPLSNADFNYKNIMHNLDQAFTNSFSYYGAAFAKAHFKSPWGIRLKGFLF